MKIYVVFHFITIKKKQQQFTIMHEESLALTSIKIIPALQQLKYIY